MDKITVIIPVYSGLEETKLCIESVINCKNETKFNILIIEDCTPDVEIKSYLKNDGLKKENIKIISNDTNVGFVKSVNIGMRYCKGDVVLLNSDTIVTDSFLDSLKRVAYKKDDIGTVCSLTNRGEILSVPYFNKDWDLLSYCTVKEFEGILKDNLKYKKIKSIKIPVAVGHCMYIKRILLNKIGLFDEYSFGKGYGEEIDFSERAVKSGYENWCAFESFVYHVGSVSFGDEKLKVMESNKNILKKRYPLIMVKIKAFIFFPNEIKKLCDEIRKDERLRF